MKTLFENFIHIILMLFFVLVVSQVVSVNMQILKANQFKENAIDRIEASYFNSQIIEDCKTTAINLGYEELVVENVTSYADRPIYKVSLKYKIIVPILGINEVSITEGNAR